MNLLYFKKKLFKQKMIDSDDKEQPIPFLVYDSNTKSNLI